MSKKNQHNKFNIKNVHKFKILIMLAYIFNSDKNKIYKIEEIMIIINSH